MNSALFEHFSSFLRQLRTNPQKETKHLSRRSTHAHAAPQSKAPAADRTQGRRGGARSKAVEGKRARRREQQRRGAALAALRAASNRQSVRERQVYWSRHSCLLPAVRSTANSRLRVSATPPLTLLGSSRARAFCVLCSSPLRRLFDRALFVSYSTSTYSPRESRGEGRVTCPYRVG